MTFFHYTTWPGLKIYRDRQVQPNDHYIAWAGNLTLEWPAVVFFTTNPVWEPSVQTSSRERYWEKCGSCPSIYSELGIPCWKFSIDPYWAAVKDRAKIAKYASFAFKHNSPWRHMAEDAMRLGSDPREWWVSDKPIPVLDAYLWNPYEDTWAIVQGALKRRLDR